MDPVSRLLDGIVSFKSTRRFLQARQALWRGRGGGVGVLKQATQCLQNLRTTAASPFSNPHYSKLSNAIPIRWLWSASNLSLRLILRGRLNRCSNKRSNALLQHCGMSHPPTPMFLTHCNCKRLKYGSVYFLCGIELQAHCGLALKTFQLCTKTFALTHSLIYPFIKLAN